MSKTYLITGGTGFIGRRLIKKLRETGNKIVVIGRESSDFNGLTDQNDIKILKGFLLDQKFLTSAMKDVDIVLHLAGYAKNWSKDKSDFYKINVDGSMNIARAALKNKVKKVVHVSTIVALGPTGKKTENEKHEPVIAFTDYEKSKTEAEKKLKEYISEGLDIVIVNPTRVYGPGILTEANSLTQMLINYLKFKNYLILGSGKAVASYVYVDDVVDGILAAVKKGKTGERYILGGENTDLWGYFKNIKAVTGKRAFPIIIPTPLAYVIAAVEGTMAKVFGKYPLITMPWIKHFLAEWRYSSEKAKKELGYNPKNLKEGLSLTCDWLKKQKAKR